MQPEYEVHNFAENSLPRRYEAVYLVGDTLLKTVLSQRDRSARGQKPTYRWMAAVYAWAPGQVEGDWMYLTALNAHETVLRDVKTHEATEDTWLEAARLDAETLMARAEVFTRVIAKATPGRKGKLRSAA
jgi:hypothetical protein